ncbi:MAG: glycosyltransferase family 1 protein [Ignavibacteriales bacterium]|nr:glycosyltransferase family 1 protein [Ignavibacteriales bacterium]
MKNAEWDVDVRPFLKRIPYKVSLGLPVHAARNIIVKQINNYRKSENRRYSEKIIGRGEYDIFHPTYYDPYFLDFLHNKPFVLTVYDMIYELFPEYYPSTQKFLDGKSLLLNKAVKIIAISETTKKDLIKLYRLPNEKIEVVYLASSLKIRTDTQHSKTEELEFPERYLLYVGNRALYKNFLFFVESILPLLSQDKTLFLICAGGKDFTQAEKLLFHTWGVKHKLHYVSVNDAILTSLYTNALAFVFPSLYEGFGIPILEAFACNCPVIISNTSSLPEIAGNACLSFDPKDKTSIIDAVNQVLSDKALREDLCKKGQERVNSFSWGRTAKETKRLYESILK